MILYRTTDRIPVRIGGVTLWVAPLSRHEKMQLMAFQTLESGERVIDQVALMANAVRFSVRKVEGVQNPDGSPYELEIGPDGYMTEQALDDLLNLFATARLAEACVSLVNEIKDHEIQGVQIDVKGVVSTKKGDSSGSPSITSSLKSSESAGLPSEIG